MTVRPYKVLLSICVVNCTGKKMWAPLLRLAKSIYYILPYPSLDICFFTNVFSCSLLCIFHSILPILVSSLTFLRVFLDSLYVFYFLFFLVAQSLSFHPIFTQNPLSTNLNHNNFLPLTTL